MHLLIPFASTLAEGCVHTLRDLQLTNLSRVMARFVPTQRDSGDQASLSPPHERALASVLGLTGADGCLPWAARQAALDGIAVGDAAWGLLTPAHWHLAANHVSLVDPAELALDEFGSRALLDAVRGLFESAGWRIAWGAPLRWYAAHETLRELPCAALDRVIGRNVDLWLPPDPRVALVRRLQSEVQMQLYVAPANDERAARGELVVNSFWLSGCGVRQTEAKSPDMQLDDSLRIGALAEDWAAWAEAWRALDAGPLATLLQRAERGEAATLTLCGERDAQRFEAAPQALWARLTRSLRSPRVAPMLEAL
jgi:hypothetical protein